MGNSPLSTAEVFSFPEYIFSLIIYLGRGLKREREISFGWEGRKEEGGLGLRPVKLMNRALLGFRQVVMDILERASLRIHQVEVSLILLRPILLIIIKGLSVDLEKKYYL